MDVLYFFLLLAGALCFAVSAFSRGRYDSRVTLLPLGLLFWIAVPLIQTARIVFD